MANKPKLWGTKDDDGTIKISAGRPSYSKTRGEWPSRAPKYYSPKHTGVIIITKLLRHAPAEEALTELDKDTLLPLSILRMILR